MILPPTVAGIPRRSISVVGKMVEELEFSFLAKGPRCRQCLTHGQRWAPWSWPQESTQLHFDEEICCDQKDPRVFGVVAGYRVWLEIVGDKVKECGDSWDFVSKIDVEEVVNEDELRDLKSAMV